MSRVQRELYKLIVMSSSKIIVSITSYPGRIKNVGMSIFLLLTQQTVKPDEIHLWLAEPQFPNKEADLPKDLQTILRIPKIKLHWTKKDTYCHKRHEIFKFTEPSDLVFLFDDDVRYNDRLIETVLKDHERFPNAIIDYEWYSEHLYNGRRIIYKNASDYSKPSTRFRWCGQSMIPASVYPMEVLDDEHTAVRDAICPVCDESWFTPWLVYHDIPIFCEHFGWGDDIDPDNSKWKGLCSSTHAVEANGYEKRDNWLYAVLTRYPELYAKYHATFNYGDG